MLSPVILNIYYLITAVLFFVMMYRYRQSMVAWLLIVIYFNGLFDYVIPHGAQLVRIVTVLWCLYLFLKLNLMKILTQHWLLTFVFALFSIYFLLDTLLWATDGIVIVFSQYSKYFVPFVSLLIFIHYAEIDSRYLHWFNRLFGELILIQIIVTVVKIILLRGLWWEGLVGTFGAVRGGGAGTSFPVVALCWLAINTNMKLTGWKSWGFIAGLLAIGIMTGKRAVIILFPVMFLLLGMWVAKRKYPKSVMSIVILSPLLLYFGLRLTPSLNPENKVWGSFDPAYVWNYAMDYSFGEEDKTGERGVGQGRVGADLLLWQMITDSDNYTAQSWLGYGVKRIYAADYELYRDVDYNFGVNHRGSLTGVFMLYIAIGLIGVILFMIYYYCLFLLIPYKRLRFACYGYVMFDFIFYNTMTIRDPALAVLMCFVIIYANIQYTSKGQYVGIVYPWFGNKKIIGNNKIVNRI